MTEHWIAVLSQIGSIVCGLLALLALLDAIQHAWFWESMGIPGTVALIVLACCFAYASWWLW